MTIKEILNKLNELLAVYGNIEVKIVNYHSDFRDDSIVDINKAIIVYDDYVLIGGESH